MGVLLHLRDTFLPPSTQRVGHTPPASLHLDTVEAPTDEGARTDQRRSSGILGGNGWHHTQGSVATEPQHYCGTSSARRVLHTETWSRSAGIDRKKCWPEQPNRRIRDPYVRWSGRVALRGAILSQSAEEEIREMLVDLDLIIAYVITYE